MRKLFIILSICFITANVSAQSRWPKVDEKYGYKDLPFEMLDSSFKQKVKWVAVESKDPGMKKIQIIDPKYLSIGDCKIKSAFVDFFNGKLYSINMVVEGAENFSCILDALNTLFGTGFKSNQYIEEYAWLGEKASILLDQNSVTKNGTLYMRTEILAKDYDTFLKTKGEKNSKDF